jgi:hypothetical protein
MRPHPSLVLGVAFLLGVTGCWREPFRAQGTLASDGPGRTYRWRSTPQGCTRDPFDGLPPNRSKSIVTLLWQNPGVRDPKLDNRDTAPDAPLRLDFSRTDSAPGHSATLHTILKAGVRLDPGACGSFHFRTYEESADPPGGPSALGGEVAFDCRVDGSRYTADVHFHGCEY